MYCLLRETQKQLKVKMSLRKYWQMHIFSNMIQMWDYDIKKDDTFIKSSRYVSNQYLTIATYKYVHKNCLIL